MTKLCLQCQTPVMFLDMKSFGHKIVFGLNIFCIQHIFLPFFFHFDPEYHYKLNIWCGTSSPALKLSTWQLMQGQMSMWQLFLDLYSVSQVSVPNFKYTWLCKILVRVVVVLLLLVTGVKQSQFLSLHLTLRPRTCV